MSEHENAPPRLLRFYERVLRCTLERRWALALFRAGADRRFVFLLQRTPARDLLPAMDEGGFIVDYIMPAGSSLDETNRVISHVENILRAIPEVESTSRRTGLQLGLARRHRGQHAAIFRSS